MNRTPVLLCLPPLLIALGMLALSAAVEPRAAEMHSPIARLVPVIRVPADGEIVLALDNLSDEPFRYLPGGDTKSANALVLTLRKPDGSHVDGGCEYVSLARHRVKEIPPHAQLLHRINLWGRWGDLKPGLYSLDASFQSGEALQKDFGLTPLHLKHRVAYLDIEEPLKRGK